MISLVLGPRGEGARVLAVERRPEQPAAIRRAGQMCARLERVG